MILKGFKINRIALSALVARSCAEIARQTFSQALGIRLDRFFAFGNNLSGLSGGDIPNT
jgi:hypothetical protein